MSITQAVEKQMRILVFADEQLDPRQREKLLKQIRSNNMLAKKVFELKTQKALVRQAFAYSTPPSTLLSED